MSKDTMDFGSRFRDARLKRNLTINDFAEIIGVTPETVNKWENNETPPSSENVDKACEILGVGRVYLLFGRKYRKISKTPDGYYVRLGIKLLIFSFLGLSAMPLLAKMMQRMAIGPYYGDYLLYLSTGPVLYILLALLICLAASVIIILLAVRKERQDSDA